MWVGAGLKAWRKENTGSRCLTKIAVAIFIAAFFLSVPLVHADTYGPSEPFNLIFNKGESFRVQSVSPSATITFTVVSGSLSATATLSYTDTDGKLMLSMASSGQLSIGVSGTAMKVTVNGAPFSGQFSYSNGESFTVRWTWQVKPPIIIISNRILYFRDTTVTTNSQMGYLLSSDSGYTNTSAVNHVAGSVDVAFGFELFLIHANGDLDSLTGTDPVALLNRTSNGEGLQYNTASVPATDLTLGYNALEAILYVKFGSGDWQAAAVYVTDVLMEKQIAAGTLQFSLYTKRAYDGADTYATAYWGGQSCKSCIGGWDFVGPLPQEVALYKGTSGDLVGMLLYPYVYIIGDLFYGMGLLFLCGLYYFKLHRWEPILMMLVLFGGGGAFGFLIPNVGYRLVYFFALFGIAILLYRVMK